MSSKKTSFPISSRMQKELQGVGSGLALDKLNEAPELSTQYQDRFIYNTFHGESKNPNSIGMVEMIIAGAAGTIVEDMYITKEIEIVDPNTPTKNTASCLQMKDICTLDPSKAYIVGKLISSEVLHGSTKTIEGPWIVGRSLHSQASEVHKNCKKALGYGRNMLDAEGFVKSGNLQPDYFDYVNTCMHKLKYPQHHVEDEKGELTGTGKPDGWMFFGYIFFVLFSPRVEKGLDNSKVSSCFSRGDENLKGEKGAHGRAAAKRKQKLAKDSARTSANAEASSLGGGRGMDMKLQLGSAMLCAQIGHNKNEKMRMRAETVGGILVCAQKEKQDSIEMLKMFDQHSEEWDDAMIDLKKAQLQIRNLMDQLSHIAALNDDGNPDRKRSADEEVTEEFVESLRPTKCPAAIPPLHQPSQPSQASHVIQGQFSQMVDLQALEDLKEAAVEDLEEAAADIRSSSASFNSKFTDQESVHNSEPEPLSLSTVPFPTPGRTATQIATPALSAIATTTAGPSTADETNTSFPYCGAGKYCMMPNKRLDAGCYDWNKQPKHRCMKCLRLLHSGICGTGEGLQITCLLCNAKHHK
jgi:hypothetical protein